MNKSMNKSRILLVGHGSRNEAGNQEIREFSQQWQQKNAQWDIDLCFIELATPLIAEGLEKAAEKADCVTVVPLILNAAGHVKEEIPEFIEAATKKYPNTKFQYAKHLGVNDEILSIMIRSLRSALKDLYFPDPRKTGAIVLARGSSDRQANGEMAMLSRWLFEMGMVEQVDLAFTGITNPRLESAVERQINSGISRIAILPYYLFTGTLIKRIERQTELLVEQFPEVSFSLGSYFGFEEEIFQLLKQRVDSIKERDGNE